VRPQRCSGAALAGLLCMPSSRPLLGVADLPAAGGHLQISISVPPLPAWLPGAPAAPPLLVGHGGEGAGWCGAVVVSFTLPGRPWWEGGRPAQDNALWLSGPVLFQDCLVPSTPLSGSMVEPGSGGSRSDAVVSSSLGVLPRRHGAACSVPPDRNPWV
jgi:hypothetical protein